MKSKFIVLTRILLFSLTLTLVAAPAFSQAHKKPATPQKPQKKPATTPAKKGSAQAALFQNQSVINFRPGQIDTFQLESVQLVNFFQGMLNFLADPGNAVRDKQTILSQSYLKIFWDSKVQIEDDLDQDRVVPLYKDAPAYLTDVSFFFKGATFTYTVQGANVLSNAAGQTYFRVTANRNLTGMTINGDSVNWNKVRYIEINYNDSLEQLKIVSIYTTKLNDREDMKVWWNGLPQEWKDALGKERMVYDTLPLSHISSFKDSTATVFGMALKVDSTRIFNQIVQIIGLRSLDLSKNVRITDLTPLGKLSSLTSLNISGTSVSDLTPLRNLNNLEELDISGTAVSTLDPLKFATRIRVLKMAKTQVADISVIQGFGTLELLDISETPVNDPGILSNLTGLTDLRFSGTQISTLGPVAGLTNLELLYFDNTPVTDLSPLKKMDKLNMIFCNGTNIKDLSPLNGLPSLTRIYCDKSLVDYKAARDFMNKNPLVFVIFETEALTKWWSSLSDDWRKLMGYYLRLDNPPSKEQLHRLAAIDSVNITGRTAFTTLAPLSMLKQLRRLDAANSGISDIKPLENLSELVMLNISNTAVASVEPLGGSVALQTLTMDNTKVSDLDPLKDLKNLKIVYADNTGVTADEALKFAESNPGCLVIFQTYENTNWWKNLQEEWKQVFLNKLNITGIPDKIQLQQIAGMRQIRVAENIQIVSLQAVVHLAWLQQLECSDTRVSDLSPLAGMKHLSSLHITKNPLTDLTPIAGMTWMEDLDVSNTQVEELQPIQNLTGLTTLKFSGTQVKNLKYLAGMVNLQVVEMYNTRVSSLDVLEPMKDLKTLKIFNTKISEKRVAKFKQTHPGCEVIFY